MIAGAGAPVVLHVNDCASTTTQLLAEARRRGLPWRYLPLVEARDWTGVRGRASRAALGGRWLGRLARGAAAADLLHVHYASVASHTRLVPRRYVLHVHGTDVRTQQYDPRWTTRIRSAMGHAQAVLYSTPDLAEHVLPHRPDAQLFAVPIDLSALPAWAPDPRPTVLFSSRWEPVKGLDDQLAVARALRARLPGDVRLTGLDWGPGAAAAAGAGVELLPRRGRADYLALLASAHVVVGQCSGMLAASELEAVGTGVPVVAALEPRWYPQTGGERPAVLVGAREQEHERVDAVVEAALLAVADPGAAARALGGPAWLAATHDVRAGVDRLTRLYRLISG